MENFKAFVPNVHFELIPMSNLVSNQDYQRKLSQRHIERTVANFHLYHINPVRDILDNNKAERHLRGGEATKKKYKIQKELQS